LMLLPSLDALFCSPLIFRNLLNFCLSSDSIQLYVPFLLVIAKIVSRSS
jgi:hypothetical protein